MSNHPYVSEDREGKPWFEWAVAACVVLCAVAAILGHEMAATAIIAVAAIATGVVRLVMRERSPWKVRSVAFDSIIGIGFGIGVMLLFLSIRLLSF
ncbi:DUF3017 domain-containing protein [Bifidobacterium choloepi]|uniref:DUF3017 domain-containing protein n=1 Tax=Bifidobacterium choloepi TaxID=2614131 RepID=A0A6I5MZ70_9BIFI|nr:DUF3017 domain-containing protein [Bifidobacterium choloepi]NEG69115.1 DUF3017 domain-containing protein [Bifidobacterium choloepi]